MFTVLAFAATLLILEIGVFVSLLILREIRIRKEEVEQLEAEIVDNTPPSFLANLEEYDNMFNGEY